MSAGAPGRAGGRASSNVTAARVTQARRAAARLASKAGSGGDPLELDAVPEPEDLPAPAPDP